MKIRMLQTVTADFTLNTIHNLILREGVTYEATMNKNGHRAFPPLHIRKSGNPFHKGPCIIS